MTSFKEIETLMRELKEISDPDPGDIFFHRQAKTIQDRILAEDESLVEELRALSVEDPGETFFNQQLTRIQARIRESATIPVHRAALWRSAWVRPLVAAAAVFLLVFGLSRIDTGPDTVIPQAVQNAMKSDGGDGPFSADLLDLEGLDGTELDRLAGRLEGSLLLQSDGPWLEESMDWDELSGDELEQLIRRIEAEVRT